jgi:pimeloyl-ACP methyl ester carboxylesterase
MKRWLRRQLHLLRRLRRNLLSVFALRFPPGIAFLYAPAPLDAREYKSPDKPTEELIIFLPGIGDVLEDYETNGFIEAVLKSAAPADIIVVDAHFGYYARRTVIERLRADVIAPARATGGYKKIWLAGISLGGFGALLYASEHSDDVHGIVLLAPFLGRPPTIARIAAAGDVRGWQPANAPSETEYEQKLWLWLRCYANSSEPFPAIYLGYGESDQFAPAHRLLASVLPQERVFTTPGGHDWRTWGRLWEMFIVRR